MEEDKTNIKIMICSEGADQCPKSKVTAVSRKKVVKKETAKGIISAELEKAKDYKHMGEKELEN